jgi:hypothetical protein
VAEEMREENNLKKVKKKANAPKFFYLSSRPSRSEAEGSKRLP